MDRSRRAFLPNPTSEDYSKYFLLLPTISPVVGEKGARGSRSRRLQGASGHGPLALRAADRCPETSVLRGASGWRLTRAQFAFNQATKKVNTSALRATSPGPGARHTGEGPECSRPERGPKATTGVPSTGDSEGHVGLLHKCRLCSGKSRTVARCQPQTQSGRQRMRFYHREFFKKGFCGI